MTHICKLSELPLHTSAMVTSIDSRSAFARRLAQLGITEGAVVTPLFKSFFGDPVAYGVKDCVIALRRSDCESVTVRAEEDGHV